MKKAKRALALALVFALVASFCVTGAAAAPGDGPTADEPSSYVKNEQAVTTEDGVTVSKTAKYVDENEYEITLEVTIPADVTVPGSSANVVLVIDRSGSMGDDGKMAAAKEAAKAFADALLKDGNDVKMAVVSYADNVSTNQALTNNAGDVKDAVDGIRANGGTHIQAGIHAAREILEGSNADKQVIVVLSDGEPTYSYAVRGTSGWSGCDDGFLGHSWDIPSAINWFGDGELADINLPAASEVTEVDFDYTETVGSGSSYTSSVYAILDVTCEHGETMEYDYSGEDRTFTNNGDPTIAEADFARADGYEVYGLYLGTPNENAQHTMQGVADNGKYQQADTDSLNGLLQDIAGDVTSTTAGAVTDPMGENIVLGDVSGLGVTVEGNTLSWNPRNGEVNDNGSTTYTVTYPITVDGEALTESDWLEANGRTTFSYRVNGEHKTVDFNVPLVWGEKVETETPHDVYVYVKVVGENGADGNLSDEELAEVREWGLTTLNNDGYFTIGKVSGCLLPPAAENQGENVYGLYGERVNLSNIERYDANSRFVITGVEWYDLKVADGANDYVQSGTDCWHLDGKITLEDLEERLVTVTYDKNADDATGTMEPQSVIKGFDVTLRENEYELEGYTFTGWNTEADGTGTRYENGAHIDELNAGLTLYAQWSRNTNKITIEVYVDGSPVDINAENFDTYISDLRNGTNTDNWSQNYSGGKIVGTYSYDTYDSADIVLTPNSNYVLQGIEGTFIQGSQAWQGITQSDDGWKIDNVKGGSTLKVYLNTKYSVEYVVTGSETIKAPTDDAVYVTGAGVTSENMANVDNNDGAPRSWKNNGLTTKFTIANVPEGATGWTDEANDSQTAGTEITVSEAVAAGLNGDDNTFTFTAKANEYTVTYTDGVEGIEVFANQIYDNLTYGTATPGFEGTPEREGYNFVGWNPAVADTVTETVTYVAQWKEITGTLTVTKTVEGLEGNDTLPSNFSITVTGPDSFSQILTLNGKTPVNGVYTWEIKDAPYGEYTITETNTTVFGYTLQKSSVKEATASIKDENGDTAALKNVYVKDNPGLGVDKTVYSVNGDTTVPEMVKVGDVIVYQIVVKNTGNVLLEKISVTDTLGDQTLTVYTDADCKTKATAFDLDVNETKELYATYTVQAADAGTKLTNTATAEDEDGTEDSGEVTVNVTPQYKVEVVYHYDTVDGTTFTPPLGTQTVFIYDAGEDWDIGTVPEKVSNNGENYIFDESRSDTTSGENISENVTVNLVYVKDEWKDDDPDGDSETGGDDIPDYRQALIVYEVAEGQDQMGGVSPTIDVVTLNPVDDTYKDSVTAESTATANTGYVFESWAGNDYSPEVQTNVLSHEFTAVGGEEYVYTASFRAGTTGATIDKQLVSYTRGDAEPTDIPEDFKARVGDVLNYTITVKNTGEVALNTTVRDTIDGKGKLAINPGTGYTVEDGVITITNLAPNATVTISASYTVVADDIGQTITNTATVDLPGDEPGGDPTDEEKVEVDEYGITVTPADITIYMGGDEGYEAVVGENGQVISDNDSLPTPLFTVELSESFGELSVEQIEAIVIAGTTSGEETRGWSFDYAGKTEDGEDLYYIVPDAGQEPIRVTYTDGAGNAAVSDHFDPTAIDELFAEFAIELYTGTVTSVTAEVKGITCEIDYSGKGKLTVRAVDDTDENPVVGVQVALPRPVEAGEGAVTAPAGTTYALNETTVEADAAGVGLLFDGIIDDGADRTGALLAELESELGVTVEDGNYQAQYLDLVDAHNGNAWVKASGAVTVYWGYPEGTGEDTDFALYHFEGLHREGANSGFDIEDVATSDIERVTITKTANGIAFDISSGGFSPFVLVWDDGDGGDEPWWPPIGPGDDDDDGDDGGDGEFVPKWLNIDDHYAYIIGYEDGTVRPQGNITRAEVATIFFRLLTDEVRAEYWSTVSGYTDVKAGDWYNNAISTLSDLGIITGYEDGTFRPNASISRAEFVTIATRFFDYAAEYEGAFSDVSYLSWYADFVQAAVDMGLVNGYENGTFRPNASITRAEAVAIVNRVLLRRPDADHLLPWSVMNTFSDNVLESAWYYEDIQEATNSHDYEWLKSGVEDWTEKLPERDWAALEREWSSAYDAPGGEVTG